MLDNHPVVKLEAVEKIYRRGSEEIHALKDVHLKLAPGAFVSVLGASGSGKTTLLNIIGCLDRPSHGSVQIDGDDIGGLDEKALVGIRRTKIGFIFQQFYLIPSLNVRENIALPLIFSRVRVSDRYIDDLLDTVGLTDRGKHKPNQLSGGEMQRVAIARALVNRPRIILADEPTGNLDLRNKEIILELFTALNKQQYTIIVATHDLRIAERAHNSFSLSDGKLCGLNNLADYFSKMRLR